MLAREMQLGETDREEIGSYRGFDMELSFNVVRQEFEITLHDEMRHRTALGKDARGNITRLDNTIASIPERLENAENKLSELQAQQESAREESRKPFAQEAELSRKTFYRLFTDKETLLSYQFENL